MTFVYNHCDPLEKQTPLPIKIRELQWNNLSVHNYIERRVSVPTSGGQQVVLLLRTDSEHLAKFFAMNWPTDLSSGKPDATITALKESALSYGLGQELDESRWFCPKANQVWMFGNEFYGNIKITVRGLCSEIAPLDQMFLHGCSLAIDGRGIVLSGASGAGKTTLTAALRKMLGSRIHIINDDWGPFSPKNGRLQFTGEPYLHMKYPSVGTLATQLKISPAVCPSENFSGDVNNPRARLLIAPNQVFGFEGLQNEAKLRLFVVIRRDPASMAGIQYLSRNDISLLERSQYSRFYQRTECFFNGSLFLFDDARKMRERDRHRALLSDFPCISINNTASPKESAELILAALEKISSPQDI
ncbi:MAG: hypothetical protein Q8Q18_00715 [bacterium]|nr:hypothetical protein [bacterium]